MSIDNLEGNREPVEPSFETRKVESRESAQSPEKDSVASSASNQPDIIVGQRVTGRAPIVSNVGGNVVEDHRQPDFKPDPRQDLSGINDQGVEPEASIGSDVLAQNGDSNTTTDDKKIKKPEGNFWSKLFDGNKK